MKLKIFLLPISIVALLIPTISTAKPICPSHDFTEYLSAFREDVSLQSAFSVKSLLWRTYTEDERPVKSYRDISQVSLPLIVDGKQQSQHALNVQVQKTKANHRKVVIGEAESDAYLMKYYFVKRKACWFLTQVDDFK